MVGSTRMRRLGIEQLSVFGLPPVEFVNLAADLGCNCISTGLTGLGYNPHGYRTYSLRDDAALRGEMKAAMRDRGVSISLGEGCNIRADSDIRHLASDMDIMAELGAETLNTVSLDPDMSRSLDQLAIFADMAAQRGMVSTVELCPVLVINNLANATAAVRHVGRRDFRLLLDTMHLGRSGATGADVRALDPAAIGYVQLCDAPRVPSEPNYMMEATFQRMIPGSGDMPLRDYVAALPGDVVISLEVPLKSQAEAGTGPSDRLRPAIAAMQALLASAETSAR
jgi:sugar phosphate isomerase/epimerase